MNAVSGLDAMTEVAGDVFAEELMAVLLVVNGTFMLVIALFVVTNTPALIFVVTLISMVRVVIGTSIKGKYRYAYMYLQVVLKIL